MATPPGLEPGTERLVHACSSIELRGHMRGGSKDSRSFGSPQLFVSVPSPVTRLAAQGPKGTRERETNGPPAPHLSAACSGGPARNTKRGILVFPGKPI